MSHQRIIFSAAGEGTPPPTPPDTGFEYVQLLLKNTTTNGQINNSFVDSSTNAFNVSAAGDSTQGAITPYYGEGYYSVAFDGSGDYLSFASNAAYTLGTGAFSLEAWFFPTNNAATVEGGIVSSLVDSAPSTFGVAVYHTSGGNISAYIRSSGTLAFGTSVSLTLRQWNHIVICRDSSNNAAVFLNGSRITSGTNSTNINTSNFTVGRMYTNTTAAYCIGRVSSSRLVKGSTPYDPTQASITVPTAPLTAVANTQVLVCASNRFVDRSTNNFTVTPNGNAEIMRFSPFNPMQQYSTAAYAGSVWFDGTGDYLTLPDNTSAIQFGSGNFTVEFWVYMPTSTNPGRIVNNWSSSTATAASWEILSAGAGIQFNCSTNGTSNTVSLNGSANLRSWNHVAAVRDGNVFTLYINGASTATTTQSITLQTANTFTIGSRRNGASYTEAFAGFICNLRIVKGTAIYTGNFTPPTIPVTAVAGTSLLLNFSNAGVYDAATASIQRLSGQFVTAAAAKFGSTSIRFNGTGSGIAVSTTNGTVYNIGYANFTIEFWLFPSNVSSVQILFDFRPPTTDGVYPMLYISDGGNIVYDVSAGTRIITGSPILTGQWYHVALSRSGSSTKLFLNGNQVGSTYTDNNVYLVNTTRFIIGASAYNVGTLPLNGYMQDFRITNGFARYTANFTPPSSAFPTY